MELETHIKELRSRLRHVLIVFTVFLAVSFYFSPEVLTWLQNDLGFNLNALIAYEVIYTRLMLSVLAALIFSTPVVFYHFLKFVKPGLTDFEYRVIRNYMPLSVVLFIVGSVFAYEVIVKSSLRFFQASTAGSGVNALWGLSSTIGFALKLSAFTGVMFQLPIAALVLARAGLIDREAMLRHRTYFFLAILFVSAVVTPPDIVSQVFLTAPVMGLYQLSIFLVGRFE